MNRRIGDERRTSQEHCQTLAQMTQPYEEICATKNLIHSKIYKNHAYKPKQQA
jgi:hypothetical protein